MRKTAWTYSVSILAIAAVLVGSFFVPDRNIFAASSGPKNPSTGADDSSAGTIAWISTGNIFSSDNSYATVTMATSGNISHYLKATNFGFSIPSGATINGITVEIERKAGNGNKFRDNAVRIIKGGIISATDRSSGTSYPTSDTYATYGSTADLWGESWTYSDINSSSFGIALSSTRYASGGADNVDVDHFRITITYTPADTTPPTLATGVNPASLTYDNTATTVDISDVGTCTDAGSGMNATQPYQVSYSDVGTSPDADCSNNAYTVTTAWGTSHAASFTGTDGHYYCIKLECKDAAATPNTGSYYSANNILYDITVPNAATSLTWSETSPHNSTSVTASWIKSNSVDLANQKIQFYSDATCTVTSGSLINLASNSVQTRAFTGVDGNTYTYKITSIDNATNQIVSACSSSMVIDTTPPLLSFTDNIEAGPVASDTITASWGDAFVKKWDYDADGVCSANPGDYSKTDVNSMNQTIETNNTKYICLYAEDALGNKAQLASANPINIITDAQNVANAKAALTAASPMTATEGVDTNAVAMAQAIVNGASSGVTVSMNSSANAHVDNVTGAITYDASAENNNVTFHLVKNAANDDQIVDFHVPAQAPSGGGYGTIYYMIVASAGINGFISPTGSINIVFGGSQIYTITPDAGYQVADVLIDGISVGSVTTYTFSSVFASHAISATFLLAPTSAPTPAGKSGDANSDNAVDELDFSILMSQWGQIGSELSGDLNSDKIVDELDFSILMANWGS